jgi:uncharacterized protein YecE (DUF72 family)
MQHIHLGTIGWSYNFWKGQFYPKSIASKDFLTYYSTKFNTVEVDSTFYRIPTQKAVNQWKNQTPSGFFFSLKFPRIITHIKMLKNCQPETNIFLERAELLEKKLGPLLLQFPPNFGTKRLADLADFLEKLPKQNRYVVEIRDEEFLNKEFYSMLKVNKVALAWVDSPNMPLNREITSDFLYIRWEGDRGKVTGTLGKIETDTHDSLRRWAEQIRPCLSSQTEVFGYFGKYYSGYPPSDVDSISSFLT